MSTQKFKELGYFDKSQASPFQKGGKELTARAVKFIKTQASMGNSVSSLIPKGFFLREDTMRIVKESSVLTKPKKGKGKRKRKFVKKVLPKFNKKGKVLTTKVQPERVVSGTIRAVFRSLDSNAKQPEWVVEELFRRPYGTDWKQQVLNKFESQYSSDSAELTSLTIIDYAILTPRKNPISLLDVKLKLGKFINVDGFTDQKWNTGKDTCVFDYLYHTYWDDNRVSYDVWDKDFINECFPNLHNPDPALRGITLLETKAWCHSIGCIKLLAFDENRELIDFYFPDCKNPARPLIFMIKHGHIYPYEDEKTRMSLTKTYQDTTVKLPSFVLKEIEEKKKRVGKLPFEVIQKQDRDSLQIVCDTIYRKNLDIKRETFITNNSGVLSFELEDTKYYIQNHDVDKVIEHYGEDFEGQTPLSIMNDILKQMGMPKSHFNKKTLDILLSHGVKDLHHAGMFSKAMDTFFNQETMRWEDNVSTIDIKRSYTSCINNPYEKWMLFDYGDHFVRYSDVYDDTFMKAKIPKGLYIVETDDTTLFLKTGIYDHRWVQHGLIHKVISHRHIKYVMICNDFLPKDYFQKFNTIRDDMKLSDDLNKLITNSICGMLGKTEKQKKQLYITTEMDEVYSFMYENRDKTEDCFFHHKVCGDVIEEEEYDEIFSQFTDEPIIRKKMINTKDFYIYGYNNKSLWVKNNLPMFIQIIGQQNMKLFDMMKTIGIHNILYRKSDALTFINDNPQRIDKLCSAGTDGTRIGAFRKCDNPVNPVKKCYKHVSFNIPETEWDVIDDIRTSDDWLKLKSMMEDGNSCLVQAPPGLGKTYMVAKLYEEYGDKLLCLAFTNVCARRIKGQTLHSAFKYNETEDYVPYSHLKKLRENGIKAIIVDEVSMITKNLWSLLRTAKDYLKVPIFGFGDKCQLKPIDDFQDYFHHPDIMDMFDNNLAELKWHDKCRHTEEEYDNLMKIREGDKDAVWDLKPKFCDIDDIDNYPKYNVCMTNYTRREVNQIVLKKIIEETEFDTLSGNCDFVIEHLTQEGKDQYVPGTHIGTGMEFMCFKSSQSAGYYNGMRYVVVAFDRDVIVIKDKETDEEICIDTIIEFLNHFTPGYCTTNHKIIGATLTDEYGIFEYEKASSDWCYVAVSRAKPLSNFKLIINTENTDNNSC